MSEIALIVGGSADVRGEFDQACALFRALARDRTVRVTVFGVNDMIAVLDGIDHAVTLHPLKLDVWLAGRAAAGLAPPAEVWSDRRHRLVTRVSTDWKGSSGLLATKIARELGFAKIVLAGVPMRALDGHFLRRRRWDACSAFLRGWLAHRGELAPFVRSLSGWTAEQFGAPDAAWLRAA
jgi:hypothetical protein